jgi:SAM-dependent methyltransferase
VFQSDAQDLSFPDVAGYEHSFDAVFTNATLHWCKRDPAAVLQGVKRALKRTRSETTHGGLPRFVGEFGGFLNVTGIRSHLHHVMKERGIDPVPLDPWYFPSDVEYKAVSGGQTVCNDLY